MADIRDEHGRPIQLTDDLGRPVQLTDEHGNPIHLTGVATAVGSTDPHGTDHMTIGSELRDKTTRDQASQTSVGSETHGGTHFAPTPVDYAKRGASAVAGAGAATVGAVAGVGKAATGAVTGGGGTDVAGDKKELERTSSSSSSEDDGQGGRRKKKGFMQKIKDKFPGHSDKEKAAVQGSGTDTKLGSNTVGAPPGVAVEQEQEKKGFLEKIKDKLPGHHHH